MIQRLFEFAGGDDSFTDAFGAPAHVSQETKLAILNALGYDVHDDASAVRELDEELQRQRDQRVRKTYVLKVGQHDGWPSEVRGAIDPATPVGYYDIEIDGIATRAIVTPERAYVPEGVDEEPPFGIAAQLYSLRSSRNWGIGDFGDLLKLVDLGKRNGAAAIALNPLHQLHLANPSAVSPYAPLSRRFLNALYIDVDWAAEKFGVILHGIDVAALRAEKYVDYERVTEMKLRGLQQLFDAIDCDALIAAFEQEHPDVRLVATYEAIMEAMRAKDPSIYSWLQWPQELQVHDGGAVLAFQGAHRERVAFFMFLQFLADRQLSEVAAAARTMKVGLYRDLAVGVDIASADVWSDPQSYALGLSVGAPPDPLALEGQNWGLPPLHPRVLEQRAYEPFITLVRSNMQHAGALRIDHVMGLKRLFVYPRENPKLGGAYISYDFEAMLGIVALESQRNRCMVVGEDLGTVPAGFRERLAPERAFTIRVLQFERDHAGGFRAPSEYPPDSVASTGTHDLMPLAGYWHADDVALRERLGWEKEEMAQRERSERKDARDAMIAAFLQHGCLQAPDAETLRAAGADLSDDQTLMLLVAAHKYLARTASRLVLMQLEDALGQREPVNVPGSVHEEPNWRRKLSVTVEDLETNDIFSTLAAAMRQERFGGSEP